MQKSMDPRLLFVWSLSPHGACTLCMPCIYLCCSFRIAVLRWSWMDRENGELFEEAVAIIQKKKFEQQKVYVQDQVSRQVGAHVLLIYGAVELLRLDAWCLLG